MTNDLTPIAVDIDLEAEVPYNVIELIVTGGGLLVRAGGIIESLDELANALGDIADVISDAVEQSEDGE